MAISTNSPDKTTTDHQTPTQQPAPDNPIPSNSDLPPSSAAPPSTIHANATIGAVNPNSGLNNLQPTGLAPPPPPPPIQSFVPPSQVSSVHPSFRPTNMPVPIPSAPQFSPIPNPSFQNHGIQVQPPGVMVQQTGAVPQMMPPPPHYGQQPMRMYAPLPNGYQMNPPEHACN